MSCSHEVRKIESGPGHSQEACGGILPPGLHPMIGPITEEDLHVLEEVDAILHW